MTDPDFTSIRCPTCKASPGQGCLTRANRPRGCADCAAYQTMAYDDGYTLTVHHGHWCPSHPR